MCIKVKKLLLKSIDDEAAQREDWRILWKREIRDAVHEKALTHKTQIFPMKALDRWLIFNKHSVGDKEELRIFWNSQVSENRRGKNKLFS